MESINDHFTNCTPSLRIELLLKKKKKKKRGHNVFAEPQRKLN